MPSGRRESGRDASGRGRDAGALEPWLGAHRRGSLSERPATAGNGQQSFDQDLLALFRQALIGGQEAVRNATNRDALTMALRGISSSKSLKEPGRGHGQAIAHGPRHGRESGQNHGPPAHANTSPSPVVNA